MTVMINYFYSASSNAFYPDILEEDYVKSGTWPNDLVGVDGADYAAYSGAPPAGMMRGANADGTPCWVEIPPPTHEQLVEVAEQQKTALLAEATAVIAPLADAAAGGYIDDADKPKLAAWQRYRYELTKVDTGTAPVISWPVKPEV